MGGGTVLVNNHELGGAFATTPFPVPQIDGFVDDRGSAGGCTIVEADRNGSRIREYVGIAGTSTHCAAVVTAGTSRRSLCCQTFPCSPVSGPGCTRHVTGSCWTCPGHHRRPAHGSLTSWSRTVRETSSGSPARLFAELHATPAQAHDDAGQPAYPGPRRFRTRDLTNVMAVAITGDVEGVLSVGIGMRKQTWIKAFTLTGPTRVVIDVGR